MLRHEGEKPDGSGLQNFICPAEPLGDGRWRLWFSMVGRGVPSKIGYAEGRPGETMARELARLSPGDPVDAPLSIGNLPEGWRPVQPVHLRLKNGKHRLYFWANGKGIDRYLAAESDDGRRYRVIDPLRPCLYFYRDRAVDAEVAAEAGYPPRPGRKATPAGPNEPPAPARLLSNDATNVYQLPDGSFEMYSAGLPGSAARRPLLHRSRQLRRLDPRH